MSLEHIFQYGALIGGGITMVAYLPQMAKLAKVRNSTGNSLIAWYLWLVGAALPLFYAIHIGDRIFILLQASYVICIGLIVSLIHRFRKV